MISTIKHTSIENVIGNEDVYLEVISGLDGTELMTVFLLTGIAKKYDINRFLEIGTWRGEASRNASNFVKEVVTIDLPEAAQVKATVASRHCLSVGKDNITHIDGDSTLMDFSKFGKFDLIFIDGTHNSAAVASDTRNALSVLNPGGIIVWHDVVSINNHDYRIEGEQKINGSVVRGIAAGMGDKFDKVYHVYPTMSAIYMGEVLPDTDYDPLMLPKTTLSAVMNVRRGGF